MVFLLVISLVNLVGIDLSLADSRKERVLAQAHARMGMMVAIGELQKHLGPDTRVTATADILDERIISNKKLHLAEHIMTQTYPLLKDPKLLMSTGWKPTKDIFQLAELMLNSAIEKKKIE